MHYLRARIGDRRPLLFVTCSARRSAKTLSAIALIRIISAVAVSASCVIIIYLVFTTCAHASAIGDR